MSIIKNGQLIAGITPVDSTSITYNTNGVLQSSGNINKNTATGTDAVKYDWVGTLSQYTTQDIEHTHPEYTCYITDDQGGIGLIYNAAQSDLRYFKKDNGDKTIISGLGYQFTIHKIRCKPRTDDYACRLQSVSMELKHREYRQIPSAHHDCSRRWRTDFFQ